MIERAHGVKRVRGAHGSAGDSPFCFVKCRIGMTQTGVNAELQRLANNLGRTGKLRSDGHDLERAAARLPKFVEELGGRREQVLDGMHSALRRADKRPFQVNRQWTRPEVKMFGVFRRDHIA